jgi:hypothetical protein
MNAPHRCVLEGRTYEFGGDGVQELVDGAAPRRLSPEEAAALPIDLLRAERDFWRRLRAAPRVTLSGDQWYSTQRTDLDGWRYTWWEDRHDPAIGFSAERIDPLERGLSPAESARLGPGVHVLGPGRHHVEAEGPVRLRGQPGASLRTLVVRGDAVLEELAVWVEGGEDVRVEGGSLEVVGGRWEIDPTARAVRWRAGECRFNGVQFVGADVLLEVHGGSVLLDGCQLSHGGFVVGGTSGQEARLHMKGGSVEQPGSSLRVEAGGRLCLEGTTLMRPLARGLSVLDGGAAVLRNVHLVRAGEAGVVVHPAGRLEMSGGRVFRCAAHGIQAAGPTQLDGVRIEGCMVGIASYAPDLRLTDVEVDACAQGGVFVYYAEARAHLLRCTVRGSGDANLEVASHARVESVDGVYEGGRAAGVHAREGAHVAVRGGRIAGNTGAAAEGLDGGEVRLHGVAVEGALVGGAQIVTEPPAG